MMIMELNTLINKILAEKKSKNNSYSLRALARDLEIDAGQLHRVVTSKMAPSPKVAFQVGKYLNLSSDELLRLIEVTLK
jgi:plasmid maintenance system antidote protein VapI